MLSMHTMDSVSKLIRFNVLVLSLADKVFACSFLSLVIMYSFLFSYFGLLVFLFILEHAHPILDSYGLSSMPVCA